jgi:hypothetical protein
MRHCGQERMLVHEGGLDNRLTLRCYRNVEMSPFRGKTWPSSATPILLITPTVRPRILGESLRHGLRERHAAQSVTMCPGTRSNSRPFGVTMIAPRRCNKGDAGVGLWTSSSSQTGAFPSQFSPHLPRSGFLQSAFSFS